MIFLSEFTRSYEQFSLGCATLTPMDTLIPALLRRQRNKRRLTLEMLYAKVAMSPQHLSEIESGKRDPRLSSIERMAEAMGKL
jgi:predicted transcriptional regulator